MMRRHHEAPRLPTRYGALLRLSPFAAYTGLMILLGADYKQVFFDIEHGDKPIGRVVLGLYGKTVPKVSSCNAI